MSPTFCSGYFGDEISLVSYLSYAQGPPDILFAISVSGGSHALSGLTALSILESEHGIFDPHALKNENRFEGDL
jgi:hypothetical protein